MSETFAKPPRITFIEKREQRRSDLKVETPIKGYNSNRGGNSSRCSSRNSNRSESRTRKIFDKKRLEQFNKSNLS